MFSLVLFRRLATGPAVSHLTVTAASSPSTSHGAATVIALVVAIVLIGWALAVLRQALVPFFEMVRMLAKAAFVAVLTAGAFVALMFALLAR